MPSEHRRRKDDTWTPEELDKALKGPKDDMHRSKRKTDDGDRRRHKDDVNGSDRRREDDRKSHRREDEEKSRQRHKNREESPEVNLTEEDRERLRRERREKREGGKEEKKTKPKESKPSKVVDDDRDDRRRGHRSKEEEPRKHKSDGDRHGDKDRERRHHDDKERRHHDDRERRHHDDRERQHHDGRQRHHKDGDDGRRRRKEEEENKERRRHDDGDKHQHHEDDDEEERERRRQERRERKERERQKEKDQEREKESHRRERHDRDKDREKDRDRERDRERDKDREREREREERKQRERREREQERKESHSSERHSSKHQEDATNGYDREGEKEDNNDDYDYEEDFEDYEDDFEDDEDPEMKEEGEMEEVLRALDEENNRLQSTSRRSNWSDSTELSDERFKEHNREEDEPRTKAASKPKTFINFVSAKQRVMDRTLASKARKRFDDLSKLIELDVAKFDMFDLPPVKEYEIYIRSFGRSDTQQAYVQTHDDDIEKDIQTEEIESLSKWTQHPPDSDVAVGGEGITVVGPDAWKSSLKSTDSVNMSKFVEDIGQLMVTILEEESSSEQRYQRDHGPTASFSESTSQLGMPNFLEGRLVTALSFCQSDPSSILSVHTLPYQPAERSRDLSEIRAASPVERTEEKCVLDRLSLICVWNLTQPAYPYRICGSEMQVMCACFSPTKASLVFSGMHDGSLSVWDLREPTSQHPLLPLGDKQHVVRFPTYNTAGVLETDNHLSPIVSIAPVYSNIVGSLKDEQVTESSSGLSFQLASVEEKAMVNLWVVAELSTSDPAGSENDLGLSPGGKIKILKSSTITLINPNKYFSTSDELKTLNLRLHPGDLNHFYVGTDTGHVVHGVRFGNRAFPQGHSTVVDSPVAVSSLDFSPFGQPYFLTGCGDGSVHLFNTKLPHPVASWKDFVSGEKVLAVRWSHSRPTVFFVLDNNSTLFTFDLVENGLWPIKMDRITAADALCLEIGGDPSLLVPGSSRPAYMVLALDNGVIEVLTVSEAMRKQQPLEEEFLASYIDRF